MKNILILEIKGGLGNQMFQYAAGFSYAKKNNLNIKLDLNWYKYYNNNLFPRPFLLNIFNLDYKVASNKELVRAKGGYIFLLFILLKKYLKNNNNIFSKNFKSLINILEDFFTKKVNEKNFFNLLNKKKKYLYMSGYFSDKKYFNDIEKEILNIFKIRSKYISNKIENYKRIIINNNSVSIHVRRGDYKSIKKFYKLFGLLDINYYKKSIQYIKSKVNKPVFFIFSDDIEWCKKNLNNLVKNKYYIQDLNSYEDLYLMSCCKHNIIANSTFSWWGSYLNNNYKKIIIRPKNYYRNNK